MKNNKEELEENNRDIILREIQTLRGPKKEAGDSIQVRCLFHDDKSPSMGIFTSESGKIPLGYFSCFGCGKKGPWNVLARKAGLQRIKEWANYKESAKDLLSTTLAKKLMGTEGATADEILKSYGDVAVQPWPEQLDWRGYKGSLIRKLGGKLIDNNISDSLCLFLPVNVRRKCVGGIQALMTKTPGKPSYYNSKGDWIKNKGLFPYDHVQKMLIKHDLDFVVLVEGPRDALRLIVNGIPALAVLGAKNFGTLKALLAVALDVDKIYLITDNDEGGDETARTILPIMRQHLTCRRIKLPKGKILRDKEGIKLKDKKGDYKREKLDPGNVDQSVIDKIKKVLNLA
jgi:5S rRNA maturation endonuclease (ribonuclease M5)